jgi:hypothetical protein
MPVTLYPKYPETLPADALAVILKVFRGDKDTGKNVVFHAGWVMVGFGFNQFLPPDEAAAALVRCTAKLGTAPVSATILGIELDKLERSTLTGAGPQALLDVNWESFAFSLLEWLVTYVASSH